MIPLPVVQRELQVASRRPATYWLRSIIAAALVIVFLCAILGDRNQSAADIAQQLYSIAGAAALTGCLLAGMFQTSDCLSSEKREGTLGLLFLTDLRGYDIVLGKLASSSLGAMYGLLAILPVLGMPLLMGGVSFHQFLRLIVLLLTALSASLSIGMLASALTREARQSMSLTFLVLLIPTCIFPAISACLKALSPGAYGANRLLNYSLYYSYYLSFDQNFNSRVMRHDFWMSIAIALATAFLCLILASLILPQVWHERATRSGSRPGFMAFLRYGSTRARARLRRRLLLPNPFFWLGMRDRLPRFGANFAALLVLPLWYGFIELSYGSSGMNQYVEFSLFCVFALSLITRFSIAAEASRRLNDDHLSGALELLLVTPLTIRRILFGQKKALRRQFLLPFLLLLLLFIVQFARVVEPVAPVGGTAYRDPMMPVIVLGGLLTFPIDCWAISWVAMWCGLRSRQHHRAILATVLRLFIIPWILYFMLGFSGFFNGNTTAQIGMTLWFVLGVANDLFWGLRARHGLLKHFRAHASGTAKERRRPRTPPLLLQPAHP